MKIKFIVIVFLFASLISFGQVTNEGNPLSWDLNLSSEGISSKSLPELDMEQIRAQDLINDEKPDSPWRFGYDHSALILVWKMVPGLNWKMEIEYGDYLLVLLGHYL